MSGLDWLPLYLAGGLRPDRLSALMLACKDPDDALRVAAVAPAPGDKVAAARAAVQRCGCRVIALPDPEYPALLRQAPDPPPLLFVLGELPDAPTVALVGSRRPTPYGITMASRLAGALARAGVCVVSGMARGIDSAAHRAALDGGGVTVAVLGCGVDVIYPPENADLYGRILQRGAIVSEQPPGAPPLKHHFPARNRIISGLSLAVAVVEAAARSGALITADCALEQGRDVFAVPGPATSELSQGPNRLIREGASLLLEAGDLLSALQIEPPPPPGRTPTVGESGRLLQGLGDEPLDTDTLSRRLGWSAARTAAILTELELDGRVLRLPDGRYSRTL